MSTVQNLKHLGGALDSLSYQRLQDTYPQLAEAVDAELAAGRTPADIRAYVLRHTGHAGLAQWCQAAARAALAAGNGDS